MVCPLHDLSISGASVVTPMRPELGAEVMVDKRRADRRAPPRARYRRGVL